MLFLHIWKHTKNNIFCPQSSSILLSDPNVGYLKKNRKYLGYKYPGLRYICFFWRQIRSDTNLRYDLSQKPSNTFRNSISSSENATFSSYIYLHPPIYYVHTPVKFPAACTKPCFHHLLADPLVRRIHFNAILRSCISIKFLGINIIPSICCRI